MCKLSQNSNIGISTIVKCHELLEHIASYKYSIIIIIIVVIIIIITVIINDILLGIKETVETFGFCLMLCFSITVNKA